MLADRSERLTCEGLTAWLRSMATDADSGGWGAEARATLHVLADLGSAGWRIRCVKSTVYMVPPALERMSPETAKGAVRRALSAGRAAQLAEPSTRRFIESMHAGRRFEGERVSILDLADDGPSLAHALSECGGHPETVVRPYLQPVATGVRCSHTGMLLTDIWRYFRHTWSLTYRPTPGRTLCFLIRNAARPKHPVMAIAGLANAVFQLASRDAWVGWTVDELAKAVTADPARWSAFRDAARAALAAARDAVRSDDLLAEVGSGGDVLETARKLADLAHIQAEVRKKALEKAYRESGAAPAARTTARLPGGGRDWSTVSESPLYKRKRAGLLSDVLGALNFLENEDAAEPPLRWTDASGKGRVRWRSAAGERAVRTAVREIKKAGLSARVMDVNVCGATPVYRPLLAGKLAALSLLSAEACGEYASRYASAVSEIASGMAGRPVTKPADLCLLTTTSLYGSGSSQYNRLRMPHGGSSLDWRRIGESEGFGTVHMSRETVEAVREVAVLRHGMRNVNNQFGEGANPLMRQLREGLEALRFSSDDVLRHSNKRIVYAAELYPGAKADLALGSPKKPELPSMEQVAAHWSDRWLRMRIREDVLEAVGRITKEVVGAELLPVDEVEKEPELPLAETA
jgi:hypothetical protein